MKFGEKLLRARKERGLTQAELAKRAGLGLKTITNYERGATYPQNREVYGRLAEILGIDILPRFLSLVCVSRDGGR